MVRAATHTHTHTHTLTHTVLYRFPLCLQLLDVARELAEDVCAQVLGDDLVLTRVVVQLPQRHQEGPAGGVPAGAHRSRDQEASLR